MKKKQIFDFQILQNKTASLHSLLEHSVNFSESEKMALTAKLYEVEAQYAQLKRDLGLPNLDATVYSKAVVEALSNANNDTFFEKISVSFTPSLEKNDYQYWLLIYLLLNDREIHDKHASIFDIIEGFFDKIKDSSLSPGDVAQTINGNTPCRTNVRLALNDLKEMGLLDLYDENYSESFALTYCGFFIAASFCINPVDRDKTPLSDAISSFNTSSFYFRLNHFIGKRVLEVSDPEQFVQYAGKLYFSNTDLEELALGPNIFKDYFELLQEATTSEMTDSEKSSCIRHGLVALNTKYPLVRFINRLSAMFVAEMFFAGLV